jgi:hypothetical protein
LQSEGEIQLAADQRAKLLTLAIMWIDDLQLRRSARPKQFRKCLDDIENALLQAEKACQWDEGIKRHLVHWTMETPVKDAQSFPMALSSLEQQSKALRETLDALRNCLPPDPGRGRPFDDERRIIFLADVFEEASGKAVVYAGGYYQPDATADTPFRRFAQCFYSLLPAEDKREPGGLDNALRSALAKRRAQRARPA